MILRPLSRDELPACIALAQDRDWPPEENKWGLLFDVGTVYGLFDPAGDLAGSTILTRYGDGLAAISMVLVANRYGRQGLGRRLMEHALAEAGAATVFLNATPYGRPLYERLGFVSVGMTHTLVGPFTAAGPTGSRPAGPADLPAIVKLDTQVSGADRTHLIERLPGFAEDLRVIERHGAVTGYAGAWRTPDYLVIGPVIAETPADARILISDIAGHAKGPVRLDLDGRHPELRAWTIEHGAAPSFETAVMVLDGRPLPGDRSRWYLPVMQALG